MLSLRRIFLYVCVLNVGHVLAFESQCDKLQVSSDIQVAKNNVVKDGLPSDAWNQNSANPQIVSASILLDYLYVTIEGSHKTLDLNAFKLQFDDHFFANSSLSLANKKVTKSGTQYTLEIKYRCKEYGGALIDYQIDFNIPSCGLSHIYWKKLCGNPLIPRVGFSMDVEYKKYNQTIVKNGLLINASYFDEDLDNLVYTVPFSTDQTKFYLYMDLPSKTKDEKKAEFFDTVVDKLASGSEEDQEDAEFQMLESILKMMPEAIVSTPILDADTSIMNPRIGGQLQNGGTVTEEPQSLILTYNCIDQAESTIELSIPLDYFRDLNLIFVKQCGQGSSRGKSGPISFLKTIMMVVFLFFVGGTIYNLQIQKKLGLDAVPFGTKVVKFLLKFEQVKNLVRKIGVKSDSTNQFQYNNANEDVHEQEFNLESMQDRSNKYGSI